MKTLQSHSRAVIAVCAMCFAVSVLGAEPAHADIPSVLQNIVTMLTGQVARLLAIIAVIATTSAIKIAQTPLTDWKLIDP
jgi:type IV secretion system protein VirB2